jgi:hypothetical protein
MQSMNASAVTGAVPNMFELAQEAASLSNAPRATKRREMATDFALWDHAMDAIFKSGAEKSA